MSGIGKAGRNQTEPPASLHRISHQPPSGPAAPGFRQRHRLGAEHRTPQIRCALRGGIPLPHREEDLRFPKDSLLQTAKKPQPIIRAVYQRQPVYACYSGWLPMPRLGFLHPLGRKEDGKWKFCPQYGLYTFGFAVNFGCLRVCRGL